jgi:F-type H+-transporting ATPase subunit epsilon
MNLNIQTPAESFIFLNVIKIIAEGEKGYFCLLPHHIDFVASIKAGILRFDEPDVEPAYFAVDEGILVKKGDEVYVSVRNAFTGTNLTSLRELVEESYENIEEDEKKTRSIIAKLESDMTRLIFETK